MLWCRWAFSLLRSLGSPGSWGWHTFGSYSRGFWEDFHKLRLRVQLYKRVWTCENHQNVIELSCLTLIVHLHFMDIHNLFATDSFCISSEGLSSVQVSAHPWWLPTSPCNTTSARTPSSPEWFYTQNTQSKPLSSYTHISTNNTRLSSLVITLYHTCTQSQKISQKKKRPEPNETEKQTKLNTMASLTPSSPSWVNLRGWFLSASLPTWSVEK